MMRKVIEMLPGMILHIKTFETQDKKIREKANIVKEILSNMEMHSKPYFLHLFP